MVNTPQPVNRTGPLVPAPTPLPAPDGPGAPPAEPVPHASGAPGRAELPAAGPALPPAGTGPRGAAASPPARHDHHGGAKGKRWPGRGRAGLHELRSGGLDGGLQASHPGYHGAQAIHTIGSHGAGVHGCGRYHGTRGGVASETAAPRPLPRHTAPPAGCNAHTEGTPHSGAAVCRRGGATGRRRGEFCPTPRPGADRGKHTRAAARRAPPVARHAPRAHPRQGRRRRRTPSRASAGGGASATRLATRPSCTATPAGTGRTSWPGAAGPSGTAPPGKGHSGPSPMSTGSKGPPRPTI